MVILKWISIIVVIAIVLVALVPLAVTQIENHQAKRNKELILQMVKPVENKQLTAVIYFSRSESTALLAHHIGKQQSARLFRLEAPDYKLGLWGWINAMLDAREHEAQISPEHIDLSAFDTIYLGSPIWLYSPAPPIWDFIENNQFEGKKVVLFNTFNSKFEQKFIDNFKSIVMEKGAVSFEHQYIRRGRMGQQLSPEEMLKAFDGAWASKADNRNKNSVD